MTNAFPNQVKVRIKRKRRRRRKKRPPPIPENMALVSIRPDAADHYRDDDHPSPVRCGAIGALTMLTAKTGLLYEVEPVYQRALTNQWELFKVPGPGTSPWVCLYTLEQMGYIEPGAWEWFKDLNNADHYIRAGRAFFMLAPNSSGGAHIWCVRGINYDRRTLIGVEGSGPTDYSWDEFERVMREHWPICAVLT